MCVSFALKLYNAHGTIPGLGFQSLANVAAAARYHGTMAPLSVHGSQGCIGKQETEEPCNNE